MYCDPGIHDELIILEESTCPYCDQLLIEGDKATDSCCDEQCIENLNGIQTCLHCGLTHGCVYDIGYHDFYDNMYKIHRKSVYQRKYHIENVLNDLLVDQKIELSHNQRDRIYKVFDVIGTILNNVNGNRKRMISTKFIMRKILEMMRLPYNQIPISRSKRTLVYYEKYFNTIMSLIGNKINSIIVS